MTPIAWHKCYNHPLPPKHKFPMAKYDLLPEMLKTKGVVSEADFFAPEVIKYEHIIAAHSEVYLNRLESLELDKKEERKTGFPQSELLIEREKRIMEGTRKACELALESGLGFNIAGGTHHAFSKRGEGFCLLNDLAIAALWLVDNRKVNNVLIIYLDVHQGNGTAEILKANDQVFTLSLHGKNNYPLQKELSDLDIEVEDGIDGDRYIDHLYGALEHIERDYDFDFVLYQCGADVLDSDKFGRLALSKKDVAKRDRIVYEFVRKHGVAAVATMGGGYSPVIQDIVDCHFNTVATALNVINNAGIKLTID